MAFAPINGHKDCHSDYDCERKVNEPNHVSVHVDECLECKSERRCDKVETIGSSHYDIDDLEGGNEEYVPSISLCYIVCHFLVRTQSFYWRHIIELLQSHDVEDYSED